MCTGWRWIITCSYLCPAVSWAPSLEKSNSTRQQAAPSSLWWREIYDHCHRDCVSTGHSTLRPSPSPAHGLSTQSSIGLTRTDTHKHMITHTHTHRHPETNILTRMLLSCFGDMVLSAISSSHRSMILQKNNCWFKKNYWLEHIRERVGKQTNPIIWFDHKINTILLAQYWYSMSHICLFFSLPKIKLPSWINKVVLTLKSKSEMCRYTKLQVINWINSRLHMKCVD